jgi:hypothetical protein
MKAIVALFLFLSASANAQILTNKLDIGDGTDSDKLIRARTTAPAATRPSIKWNDGTSKWQFTNDGTTFQDITSPTEAGPSTPISASNIDWSLGNIFTKTLSANTTFTFSNLRVGVIVVRVTNTVSNYTVTWPASVLWSGGTAPTQTVGNKSDVYTFVYDGSTVYGSVVQDF